MCLGLIGIVIIVAGLLAASIFDRDFGIPTAIVLVGFGGVLLMVGILFT